MKWGIFLPMLVLVACSLGTEPNKPTPAPEETRFVGVSFYECEDGAQSEEQCRLPLPDTLITQHLYLSQVEWENARYLEGRIFWPKSQNTQCQFSTETECFIIGVWGEFGLGRQEYSITFGFGSPNTYRLELSLVNEPYGQALADTSFVFVVKGRPNGEE